MLSLNFVAYFFSWNTDTAEEDVWNIGIVDSKVFRFWILKLSKRIVFVLPDDSHSDNEEVDDDDEEDGDPQRGKGKYDEEEEDDDEEDGEAAQRGDDGSEDDDDDEEEDDDEEDGEAAQRGDEGSALWGLDAASRGEYSIGFRSFDGRRLCQEVIFMCSYVVQAGKKITMWYAPKGTKKRALDDQKASVIPLDFSPSLHYAAIL